jgi:hypothetical protein
MRWRARSVVVLASAALTLIMLGLPAGASRPRTASRTETLTFTLPTPVVLNVEHQMTLVHGTTALKVIWGDALCDAPTEPIPRQGRSNGVSVHFEVTVVRARLAALSRDLDQYGCGSLLHDYETSLARFEQRLANESGLSTGASANATT